MKTVISYLLTAIIAILFIILVILLVINNTILNAHFVFEKLKENDYYSLIEVNIKSGFENYMKQSGLDEDVFKDIYTKQKIKEDVNMIINDIYGIEEKSIDTTIIQKNLENNIDAYLETNNMKLNEEEKHNMQDLIEKIVNVYDSEISHPVYSDLAKKIIPMAKDMVVVIIPIIIGIIFFFVIILFVVNINQKLNTIKYIAVSALIASIFLIICITLTNIRINIDNIVVLNSNFSLVIVNTLKSIMSKFIYIGMIASITSIIIIFLYNMIALRKEE